MRTARRPRPAWSNDTDPLSDRSSFAATAAEAAAGASFARTDVQRRAVVLRNPPREDKPPDQNRIVAFLAKESHRPIAEVEVLYEHERSELALDAHVTRYLHIFAIRKVRETLRQRARNDQEFARRAVDT